MTSTPQLPNVYLIGPRGSGKTCIGTKTALELHIPFIDTDLLIEQKTGMKITDIFQMYGQSTFRSLEYDICMDVFKQEGTLVATGGGCVVNSEIREKLRSTKRTVWLTASPHILAQRIAGSDRPSLTGLDPVEEIQTILLQREPLYQSCAVQCLDTGILSLKEIIHVIKCFWSIL